MPEVSKSFDDLPEDHSPLVNTVEFQLKARQHISKKYEYFGGKLQWPAVSICTHLTISLRTWYRSQVPKETIVRQAVNQVVVSPRKRL